MAGQTTRRRNGKRLVALQQEYGISPSGEGGEIETTVLDAPMFNKRLEIVDYAVKARGNSGVFKIKQAKAGAEVILVVDMNWKKDSLGYYEFVLPILSVAEHFDDCVVKHYLEVTMQDLNQCDSVILSGTALEDNATLNQPEKFQWLKETEKPVLGICAGMETIGIVFGMRLTPCLEIGMTQVNVAKENPLFPGIRKGLLAP